MENIQRTRNKWYKTINIGDIWRSQDSLSSLGQDYQLGTKSCVGEEMGNRGGNGNQTVNLTKPNEFCFILVSLARFSFKRVVRSSTVRDLFLGKFVIIKS